MKLGLNAKKVIQEDSEYISGSLVRFFPLVVKKAKGVIITDIDGRKYIDFLSGAAVANTGHNHHKVIGAVMKAMKEMVHSGTLYLYNKSVVELAKKLNEVIPGKFKKKIFFGLSGSDAIDASLKMVRWYSRRPRTLSFIGSYHGMTMGALSLSGFSPGMFKGFMPLLPGIVHLPYPFCYRCPFKQKYPSCKIYCLDYIEKNILGTYCPPEDVSAVYVEPIQGDAGVIVPPREYLPRLQNLCKKYGILLVVDEIQTGFGRTGKMFASEHWDIEPDVMVLGKAIASGFPLSAVVARAEIMNWPSSTHVITCGGEAMICEAAMATIDVLLEEKLIENAAKVGEYLKDGFNDLSKTHEMIGDVRGKGLMIGVDIVKNRETKEPDGKTAHKICFRCWELGLVMMYFGRSTLRITPPLCLTREEADKALEIIDCAMRDVELGKVSDEKIRRFSSWQ